MGLFAHANLQQAYSRNIVLYVLPLIIVVEEKHSQIPFISLTHLFLWFSHKKHTRKTTSD